MVAHRTKARLSNKIKVKKFHILIDILLTGHKLMLAQRKARKGKVLRIQLYE